MKTLLSEVEFIYWQDMFHSRFLNVQAYDCRNILSKATGNKNYLETRCWADSCNTAYTISMIIHLGYINELVRYPVKPMAGISTESAFLGWRGLQGDRRFAFRRPNNNSGFPWLTASRLPGETQAWNF